jgi:hypothetical protein
MRTRGALSINGEFVITELYLFESGRYNERFLRSLKFGSITDGVVDRLSEEILRTGGRGFSSGAIANNRTLVIQLDEDVRRDRDRLEIARGFDSKRFCYIMKIVEDAASVHHKPRTYLISGYTDKMEYSRFSRSIPDDLEFFVNALLETTDERATNNNQLFGYGNYSASNDKMYMIRPQDVISKYSFTNSNHGDGVKSSFRSDQINGRMINTNSRQNTVASNYLARTLTGLHKNRMEVMGEDMVREREDDSDNPAARYLLGNRSGGSRSSGRATELEEELERVRTVVSEDPSDEFDFLRQIRRAARETSNAGVFTFRQLEKICPEIDTVTTVNVMREDRTTRSGLIDLDHSRVGDLDGEEWGEQNQEELIATNVANAFVAACSVSFIMIVDIIFALRYNEFDSKYEWDFEIGYSDDGRVEHGSVVFADNIPDDIEKELIDRLGFIMIDDVLNSYTRQGYEIMISVRYNMNREIFISVAIDTDEPYELCTPVFCDSITSPTQSNSEQRGARLGEGSVQLYQEIFRAIKG